MPCLPRTSSTKQGNINVTLRQGDCPRSSFQRQGAVESGGGSGVGAFRKPHVPERGEALWSRVATRRRSQGVARRRHAAESARGRAAGAPSGGGGFAFQLTDIDLLFVLGLVRRFAGLDA